ncbi:MAG: PLP-dependent aminotransferase family protein [Acidobacteria bacterium]|nr:PLP-dependent aminotransferase family protein [Acidobacteriota bacterium]
MAQIQQVSDGLSPILAIDRKEAKPLHKQIYDGYRAAIAVRSLRAGQQIPSTRDLSRELKISRIPVLTAYAQLLAEGYFETRVGAGTFVCSSLPDQPARRETNGGGRAAMVKSGPRRISKRSQLMPKHEMEPWLRGVGAFGLSQPAYDQFPTQIWSSLMARHSRPKTAHALHYGGPMGFEPLREAICVYLRTARAVKCDPSQVMIVSGSQQALEISSRVVLDPGDAAWIEEPGYWLTRSVLKGAGAKMVPVPVDEEGLNVAVGVRLRRKARAAFVTPSHQYPLGVTMSASRRMHLLDWAQRAGSWVIEDDYDSEYRFENMPIASLQGLDSHARVIYIGTFSKTLFPALRLGYVVVPADLVERFVAVRHALDLTPPYLQQAVLNDFMREGHFARHIRKMRVLYHERRTALVESLEKEFDGEMEIWGAQAGMHLVAELPKDRDCNDVAIATAAAAKKVWLWPLSPAYIGEKKRQGFILGFGNVEAGQIAEAVKVMRNVVRGAK